MNVDESSVCLFYDPELGVIMKRPRDDLEPPPRFNVSRGIRRTNFTYVGFLTDDATLQRHLPHVIIGSADRIFRARDFARLFNASPDNVILVRNRTSWNTTEIMKQIVRMLGHAQAQHCPDAVLVFIFDTAFVHLNREVLRLIHSFNMKPLPVPRRMTWLLQPLDVYAFSIFKRKLKQRYNERLREGMVPGNIETFLPILYGVIEDLFRERCWDHAFTRLGLGGRQENMSMYVMKHLQWREVPAIPAGMATEAAIADILPGNRRRHAAFFPAAPSCSPSTSCFGEHHRCGSGRSRGRKSGVSARRSIDRRCGG